MTPRHRPRTGRRRDGGIRQIRTDEVRYPGVDLATPTSGGVSKTAAGGLRPVRDTGLALSGRSNRDHQRRARAQRRTALIAVLVLVAVAVLATGWKYSSDRKATLQPATAAGTTNSPQRAGTVREEAAAAGMNAVNPNTGPTPYFASYKQLKLRLPVAVQTVTEVGFHQASYSYARHMKSLAPYGDAEQAKKDRTTHRDLATQDPAADAVLTGVVLKLWRSRPGKPDTAVDVGSDAGSTVFSPVTGTVVKVKKFDLYNKYPDVEIHIQPEGYPTLDVVMIHVDNVICEPGDQVVGGVTPIAEIRDLDPRIGPQLKRYTKNGGTHTHLQVNDATNPHYKGLKGAITVGDF